MSYAERTWHVPPLDVAALAQQAQGLAAQGRLPEAAACWQQLAEAQPGNAAIFNNLGSTLRLIGRDQDAIAAFRTALQIAPDFPEACNNLGTALSEHGERAEGETLLRRAVGLRPGYARAHCNLGKLLREQGQLEAALDCFQAALRHDPNLAEAHLHQANVLLMQGRMPEGWEPFEWRLRLPNARPAPVAEPAWQGQPLVGRTLLVQASEGYGDTIQFCRYLPLLVPVATIVLRVPVALRRLLQTLHPDVRVIADTEPLPRHNTWCDLLSLPRLFGTTLESIPAATPYLRADPALVERWRRRLDWPRGARVGLVWAGNPLYPADRQRSIPAERLAALADVPGICLVSLQVGQSGLPRGVPILDASGQLGDFADTAALIEALDVVISVDTAVVHLAGALGRPVWLLNRFDTDWRWMRERDDSPWYPTLRQFRQSVPGDWDSVLQAVREQLHTLPCRPGSPAETAFWQATRHEHANRPAEAEASYRAVLAAEPGHTASLHQLGLLALRHRQPDSAIAMFGRVVQQFPDDAPAVNNLGNAYRLAGCFAEAAVCFQEALRLLPDAPKTLCNLGIAQAELGEVAEAEASLRSALLREPANPEMHLALGSLLLSVGRFEEGWPHFAWRRRIAGYSQQTFAGAELQGEPIGGRTLLLYSDEGFGDAIQCVRYLPLLRGGRIILGVQPELARLFRQIPGVAQVISTGDPMPPIDLHRPLLDLPMLLGTTLHNIPAPVPYLMVDEAAALRWHRRLQHLEGLRVGLAWSGNRAHLADHLRSIPLARFAPLFAAFPEVHFISLQKGDVRRQTAGLPNATLHDFDAALTDFHETAALVSALDLVIAIDSAVVHLAGALGVPVWLLNRWNGCWRWLRRRDDSPWYPTLRQFRQAAPNDWDDVMIRVEAALREELAKD